MEIKIDIFTIGAEIFLLQKVVRNLHNIYKKVKNYEFSK